MIYDLLIAYGIIKQTKKGVCGVNAGKDSSCPINCCHKYLVESH